MASRWPALLDELEASIALLRTSLDVNVSPGLAPRAAERHAIERSLDRYQAAAAAVTSYVDAFLASTAPRPRT
jgi:hypothetical protein